MSMIFETISNELRQKFFSEKDVSLVYDNIDEYDES